MRYRALTVCLGLALAIGLRLASGDVGDATAGEPAPTATPPPTSMLTIEVGSVRVKATRPGTGTSWDGEAPAESVGPNPLCKLVPLAHAVGSVGTVVAEVGAAICALATLKRPTQRQRDPKAPDLLVAIVAGQGVAYRTHAVPDAYAAFFQSRFRVPVASLPQNGLRLLVLDQDGEHDDETIGEFRLGRAELLEAAGAGKQLVLKDDSGAVEHLDLTVQARRAVPIEREVKIDTRQTWTGLPDVYVEAGSMLFITAKGDYSAGPVAGRRGVGGNGVFPGFRLSAPFDRAPHGAAVAMIGAGQSVTPLVVGKCVGLVVQTAGHLVLGINDSDAGNNRGTLDFKVYVFDASADTWTHPGQAVPCTRLTEILEQLR
jgi:hypothetical protein